MPRALCEANVLVVDDSSDNMFIALDLLRNKAKVNYCDGRASGRQLFKLIEALPEYPIDVILLDLRLPQEDSYTLLRQIHTLPQLANAKVIAFTANVMVEDVERAHAAGFDGFIGKPIDRNRFPEQILRIISGQAVWEPR
jgi:two-component system cell cycle response regulator DivK